MATQRTVTKVIFHDSSDDEAEQHTAGEKKPLVTTTFVDVRTDTLCMDEDDMVDPEEHLRRCDEVVGADDDPFLEDAMPDLEKAKGTLMMNHSSAVTVDVMEAPAKRTGGFVANRRPGRRPEDATSAHSTRKRLRDDEDEVDGADAPNSSATAEGNAEGMTTDEMLEAADAHGLPAPNTGAMDALDAIEEEVVKAVMLPNGTHRDPLAIKMSTEGYRLSLDENDVQDVFEDDEEDLEEDEEDDAELQLLMAVSAIEQMIGACERYQPNAADGGMCPWAEEEAAKAAAEGEAAAAGEGSATLMSSAAAEESASAAPAVALEAEDIKAEENEAEAEDGDAPAPEAKRQVYRPRIFDTFVTKGKELLAKLQANEISAEDLCDEMEDDIEQLQRAFRRINRPTDEPVYIDGVKMDF